MVGWTWILLGQICLRVHCEILAAFFMLLTAAEDADTKAQAQMVDARRFDEAFSHKDTGTAYGN